MHFDYTSFRADVVAEMSRKDLKYQDIAGDNLSVKTIQAFMAKSTPRKPSANVADKIAKRLEMDFDKYITELEGQA